MRNVGITISTASLAAVVVLGATACGGGSGPAASVAGLPARSAGGAVTAAGRPAAGTASGKEAPSTLHAGSAADLHAAADCIRTHGAPGFADPTVDANGRAYSDRRTIENVSDAALRAIESACGSLVARAGFDPTNEPPAPPALIHAGVVAARCARAHGLPNMRDPDQNTPYTPGHGFGLTADEVPSRGKASAGFQQALHACRAEFDAEIRASTLGNLVRG